MVAVRAFLIALSDRIRADRFSKASALTPGSALVAWFAEQYSPPALLNRMTPPSLTRFLLRRAPEAEAGITGFKAYYARTHYSAFKRLAEKAGFTVDFFHAG